MPPTAAMTRLLVLVAALGCSDPAPKGEAPATTPPAEETAPPDPPVDAAPPEPVHVSVPPGPVRLREATLGAAVLLSARLWQLDILGLAPGDAAASFAIAKREDVGRELAARYGGEAAEEKGLVVVAPAGRAAAALAAKGKGRAMDVEYAAAPGNDLARLAADLAGAPAPAAVGGRFAVAVTAVPAGRLLAMIQALCADPAACPPVERVEVAPPSLNLHHRLRADAIEKIRLVGVAAQGARAFAALAGESAVELVEVGDLAGALDTRCGDQPAMSSYSSLDRLRKEVQRADSDIEALRGEKAISPGGRADLMRRHAELEASKAEAEMKLAKETQRLAPPAWCKQLERDALVWRVAAIDAGGVSLEPVRTSEGAPAVAGPAFPEVPVRRLPISD
ncbi:MAG TPA: hypothetical protein VIG06_00640 [Kofleriaceae bacterium]|jgi:hypothetical protein